MSSQSSFAPISTSNPDKPEQHPRNLASSSSNQNMSDEVPSTPTSPSHSSSNTHSTPSYPTLVSTAVPSEPLSSSSHASSKSTDSVINITNVIEDENTLMLWVHEEVINMRKANKSDVTDATLRYIAKLLQAILLKPTDKKNRQLRSDFILTKKHIYNVPNALAVMRCFGFKETELDGKKYLVVDEKAVNTELYQAAIEEFTEDLTSPVVSPANKVEETKQATASTPVQCKGGCGFWGDASRDGLCSQCYKKSQVNFLTAVKPASTPTATPAVRPQPIVLKLTAKARWRRAMAVARAMHRFNQGKRPVQEDKERCWECRRKLGLSGFECRCHYVFCGKHRYPQEHKCRFDHKKRHVEALSKVNLKVVADKLERMEE